MRWPWQRGTAEPPADELRGGLTEPAAAGPRVPPVGWAFLPPLQRTTGNIQLTSDPDHFTGGLAAWGDPSFTGPMTHLVSTEAPAGVIDVDGGGPVTGSGGYAASPVEMTLLPPPAPRIRPAPGRPARTPAAVQRAGSDGGASDGGRPGGVSLEGDFEDGGTLGGSSLLAATTGAFPVLHVDAAPPQSSGLTPGSPVSEPVFPVSTPVSRVEPSAPAEPRHTDGSTSDGAATYVPLPSAPGVQRAPAPGADSSPSFRQVPHPPRLGLGMPLSFSELAESPEPFPGRAPEPFSKAVPDHSAAAIPGPFPLPVQRAPAPELPGSPPVPPPADAGNRGAADAILPVAGEGPAAGTATTTAGPSDPPSVDTALAPDPGTDEIATEAKAGSAEATPSPPSGDALPSDDASAPLISTVVPHGALDQAGDSSAGTERPAPRFIEGSPASMPVVSRSGTAANSLAEIQDVGFGPDGGENFAGEPEAATVIAEPPERVLAELPDTPQPGGRAAAAAPLPLVVAPAAGQTMTAGGPAVQRSTADDGPAETALHGAEMTPLAVPLALATSPNAIQSGDGPRTSGPTDAGNPAADASSAPSNAVGVQRTTKPAADGKTRAIPTQAGPVVLRIVPTSGPRPTPDTWQRLTALPVAATGPRAQAPAVAQRTATLPGQSPANTAGPDEGPLGVPAAATAFAVAPTAAIFAGSDNAGSDNAGADDGFGIEGDPGARTEPGRAADATPGAGPYVPAGPGAAVGRVIQRTISVARDSVGQSGTVDRAVTGFPERPAAPAQMPTAKPAPLWVQRPVLQRWTASTGMVPGAAGSSPERAETLGYVANRSFTETRLEALALPGYESDTARPALLSLASPPVQRAEGDEAVQREPGFPGTDSAVPPPETLAPTPSAPGAPDSGAAVQGSTAAAPAGAAAQGTAAGGAAAPGLPAGASPEQLEELAKRLAGPLIRRIKAEMLLDRERRGLRTDMN